MSGSLKDLIRGIRGSKTASEERSILAKECAKIRSSLNSDNLTSRRKNISKLLFINLLGYPTNFGQVECIKLIASSKFSDKRIGYLALNQLLNEDSELLMLATNSIKIDLNNPNPYVCEMALRTLANIGTTEMLRELQYEIERLINSNIPNIKKKSAICTVRMLRKEANRNLTPDSVSMDLAKSFVKYMEPLISDYDNGVKTAGLSLMEIILENYTEMCNLGEMFNLLIKTMGNLMNPNNANYTVTIPSTTETFTNQNLMTEQSSSDGFVKVKLLSLMKKVYLKIKANKGEQYEERKELLDDSDVKVNHYKEKLYEIVSKIINSVEVSNNKNDAVLYECVSTIESEFTEEKFNELGKLVVKKFMGGPNNNVKYLALGIIKKLHNVQMEYGDSNWSIIVQSFKQPDVSIRMKALDVSLKVVNRRTLEPLVQYLYEFLLTADEDMKKESMHRIFNCINTHSQDVGYKLGVFVKIFTIAGNSVQDILLFDFIDLLKSSGDEIKVKTTVELVKVLRYNMGQSALVKSTLYSIGEYYELISKINLKKVLKTYNAEVTNMRTKKESEQDRRSVLNDTSIDLLLDVSTPKKRVTMNKIMENEFERSKEEDLLLDLTTPPNERSVTEEEKIKATNESELFDLYGLNMSEDKGKVNPKVDELNLLNQFDDNNSNNNNNNNSNNNNNNNNYNNVNKEDGEFLLREECDVSEKDQDDGDLAIVEIIENVSVRLMAKNLLNECEYLLTCIGKLVYKMPRRIENLRKIIKKFKRHSNAELQQRSCELEIIIQENMLSVMNESNRKLESKPGEKEEDITSLYGLKEKEDLTRLYSEESERKEDLADLYSEKLKLQEKEKEEEDYKFKFELEEGKEKEFEFLKSESGERVKTSDKTEDLFDQFFGTSDQNEQVRDASGLKREGREFDFNLDKITNNIVENVTIVSSREKKEDDFQQFDPF